jgi:hypothetical protein
MGSGIFVGALPASAQAGDQGGNGQRAEYKTAARPVAYRLAVPAVEHQAAIPASENHAVIPAVVPDPAIPSADYNNLLGALALMLLGGATLFRKRVTSVREQPHRKA